MIDRPGLSCMWVEPNRVSTAATQRLNPNVCIPALRVNPQLIKAARGLKRTFFGLPLGLQTSSE